MVSDYLQLRGALFQITMCQVAKFSLAQGLGDTFVAVEKATMVVVRWGSEAGAPVPSK